MRIIKKLWNLFKKDNNQESLRRTLIIECNSACNVRCVWCSMQNFNKFNRGMMSVEEFRGIIERNKDYLKEQNYVVEPYFRGEPLIHPDFWEFCEILQQNEIPNGGINSNLSMEIDVNQFKKYNISILVNIGGVTKEVHERVMRHSNFELVTNNLRTLWSNGIPVMVKMNPTKKNYHQLQDLPKFVEKLGGRPSCILDYTTCSPIPYAMSEEETNIFFGDVVCDEIRDKLRFTYDESKRDKAIKTKVKSCDFQFDTILFNGQFTMCCHDQLGEINLGNAFVTPIKEIVESDAYRRVKEEGRNFRLKICKECN